MPATVKRCPLCGEKKNGLFDQRNFRSYQVANRLCNHCGMVYQCPRMSTEELDTFYQEEYRRIYQGNPEPTDKDLFVQTGRAEALLTFIKPKTPAVSRHLDIGCSTGLLLQRFQSHFGCEAIGVEPGETYRSYAERQGLSVYPSLEVLQKASESRFDLISMAHVLEHLPDPVDYLVHLREQVLASSGWLLLEVPNLYAHDCFEIAHMVAFSEQILQQTLRKAGFAVVAVHKHGKPRSRLLPLYISLLAQPVRDGHPLRNSIKPERWVSPKRDLGMLRRKVIERALPHIAWVPIEKPPLEQEGI